MSDSLLTDTRSPVDQPVPPLELPDILLLDTALVITVLAAAAFRERSSVILSALGVCLTLVTLGIYFWRGLEVHRLREGQEPSTMTILPGMARNSTTRIRWDVGRGRLFRSPSLLQIIFLLIVVSATQFIRPPLAWWGFAMGSGLLVANVRILKLRSKVREEG